VKAADNTKTNNLLSSPTVILDQANAELFAPHGLFALVVTSRSDEILQLPNCSYPPISSPSHPGRMPFEARNEPSLAFNNSQGPPAAPLIYLEPDTTVLNNGKNKLRQLGDLISEKRDWMTQMQHRTHTQPEEDNRHKRPRLRTWKSDGVKMIASALEDSFLNGRKPGKADLISGVRDILPRRRESEHQGSMQRAEIRPVSAYPVSQVDVLSNKC
jgi:hypothetical protein